MALELESMLVSLTQPDTKVLKENTAKLQKFLAENPDAAGLMLQQVAQSQKTEARQMGAILLRKELDGKMWKKLNDQAKEQCKRLLIERLAAEPERGVRQAVAMLVKSVCKQIDEWPELLVVLEKMISSTPEFRETGVKLMRSLMGTRACMEHWRVFFGVFVNTLGDSSCNQATLVEATKGVGAGAAYLECEDDTEEAAQIPGVTSLMLNVLRACVVSQDFDAAGQVIEVFNDMLNLNYPVFGKQSCEVAKFMLQIANMTDSIEEEMRAKALAFLGYLCRRKMKVVQRHKLVDPIFEICTKAIMSPDPAEDDEENENSLHGTAADVLDTIFLGVPRYVFKRTLEVVDTLAKVEDNDKRYAGVLMLMLMVEGCADLIKIDEGVMKTIVEYNLKELVHPVPRIRGVACQVLVQVAQHLEPEVMKYSKPILQSLVQLLQTKFERPNSDKITAMTWSTMQAVVEEMKGTDAAKEVLGDLMGVLSDAMTAPLSDEVKESVLNVLGTLAESVGPEFAKYYRPVMNMLHQFVGEKALVGRKDDQAYIDLVGAAWETLGQVMNAVGHDNNELDLAARITEDILKAMNLDHAPKASGFLFFTGVITMYKAKLRQLPFFEHIFKGICDSLAADDGVEIVEDDDGFGPSASAFGFEENKAVPLDDAEALMNVGPSCKMQIKAVILEERSSALNAARSMCAEVPLTMDELKLMYTHAMLFFDYPHPTVRLGVTEVLAKVLWNVVNTHPSEEWELGKVNKINPNVEEFTKEIPWLWLATLEEDDDADHASVILEHINTFILKLGPGFLLGENEEMKTKFLDRLIEFCDLAIDEKLFCQQADDDEPEAEVDIEERHKTVVDSALSILGSLSKIFGTQFEPRFREFYPKLMKFCSPKRHNNFRAIAIGCLGDVIEWLAVDEKRTNTTESHRYLAPSFKEALTMAALDGEEHNQMRQNSFFCIGALFQAGRSAALPYYEPFVKAALPALELPRGTGSKFNGFIRDNAVSALCKMIQAIGSQLDQAALRELGPRIVNCLPLERDFVENKYVYPVLCQLLKGNMLTGAALEKTTSLLKAVADLPASTPAFDDETRGLVTSFVQQNS